jgi:DHA1 family 2-module integral membrane pump EmrD-like MFS transporter
MSSTAPEKVEKSITATLFIILLGMFTLSNTSADMYVPALPAIAKAFATKASTIQYTLAIFMFGFGISHLFYGPISDRVGRRKPVLFGISITIIGSLMCVCAPTTAILILGRFVQGIGVGACNSVGRSIIRDILSGPHLAKIGSYLGMAHAIFLAFAPTLGGYIQNYLGWRAIFITLTLYATVVWMLVFKKLPETNQHTNPSATQLRVIAKNFFTLMYSNTFVGYTLCSALSYAGIITYLTSAPFLLQNIVGLTPVQFGWLSFALGGAIFLSAIINGRYVVQKGIEKMIFFGVTLMLISGLSMMIFAACGYINTWVIVLPVILYCIGAGLNFANAFAGASHDFPKMAGTVGALFGCIQILCASLSSSIVALLHERNQMLLALMLTMMGILVFFSLRLASKAHTTKI